MKKFLSYLLFLCLLSVQSCYGMLSNLSEILAIRESGYFDERWYLAHYPDVAAARVGALLHFKNYGWKEGRNPGPLFNTNLYLQCNPDVRGNPLLHYIRYGKNEGRPLKPTTVQQAAPLSNTCINVTNNIQVNIGTFETDKIRVKRELERIIENAKNVQSYIEPKDFNENTAKSIVQNANTQFEDLLKQLTDLKDSL